MKKLVNGELVDMAQHEIEAFIAESESYEATRADRQWVSLRKQRDLRLAESDWTQVADAPVDQAAWSTYRQALRDLPSNTVDPFNPVWPTKP